MPIHSDDALFPPALKRSGSLAWTVLLPAVLLAFVNSFTFWLVWGEMKAPGQRGNALLITGLALLPALTAGLAAILGFRRGKGVAFVSHLVIGLLACAYLTVFCLLIGDTLPRNTPQWAVGASFWLAQFACMMPAIFVALWRLASVELRLSIVKQLLVAGSSVVLMPTLAYLFLNVFHVGRWFHGLLGFIFLALLPVCFFLGLLRMAFIVKSLLVRKSEQHTLLRPLYIALVALVLPSGGLLLNRTIPFPANFQSPWVYGLTVLNALFLLAPALKHPRLEAAQRAGRLVLFPFSLYFFILFLPFLPFSLLAIIAMGTGFLVLAPTLLFLVHLQVLKDEYRQRLEHRSLKAARIRTALAILVLPAIFLGRAEFDRLALHRLLDFRYAPDYAQPARLGLPPAAVKRILLNVQGFKNGAEIPYLSSYYNWRVFDNMLLPDARIDDLWQLIVGEPPPAKGARSTNNEFASLFFSGRVRNAARSRTEALPPRNVFPSALSTTAVTTNGETEVTLHLSVTSHDASAQSEYSTRLQIPPGVWVSGVRLKIGDDWTAGRIIERKAAEWVYRQIRDVTRQDPVIIRYEDEDTLSLRLFPVESGQTREVELSFLFPTGFADAISLGDLRVPLTDGDLRFVLATNNVLALASEPPASVRTLQAVSAAGIVAAGPDWAMPESPGQPYLIIDCSVSNRWGASALEGLLGSARAHWPAEPSATVICANYDSTVPCPIPLQDPQKAAMQVDQQLLPRRGSLDAGRVLRSIARQTQPFASSDKGHTPLILFAGNTASQSLAQVSTATWEAFRHECPAMRTLGLLNADGRVTAWTIPGGTHGSVRLSAGSSAITVIPEGTRWAAGAKAWRLQREFEAYPARDHLRREILEASRASGVLTPAGAMIVVESRLQWKMLEVMQRQTLAGNDAFDLQESPAPPGLLLLALLAFVLGLRMLPVDFFHNVSHNVSHEDRHHQTSPP